MVVWTEGGPIPLCCIAAVLPVLDDVLLDVAAASSQIAR